MYNLIGTYKLLQNTAEIRTHQDLLGLFRNHDEQKAGNYKRNRGFIGEGMMR